MPISQSITHGLTIFSTLENSVGGCAVVCRRRLVKDWLWGLLGSVSGPALGFEMFTILRGREKHLFSTDISEHVDGDMPRACTDRSKRTY